MIVKEKPVVVVTGASAGVGRAVALNFARHGWRVALLARGRARLKSVAAEIQAAGGETLELSADVADAAAIEAAAERVLGAWGKIDVWINNAMVTVFGTVETISPDEFRRVTEVAYLGQVHGTQTALKHMRRAGRGTIVCIGSALTYRSIPLQSAYCGAKAAIRGFVDALRCELLHESSPLKLTMVHLPAVNTEQFSWARCKMHHAPRPVAPVFTPEAVAAEVYRGALTAPRELWVGRPTVKTILGGLLFPGVTDRVAAATAFKGQLDADPKRSGQPDNLFNPVDPKQVIGGRFGGEARQTVGSVSGSNARAALASLGLGMILSGIYAAGRPRIRRRRWN